MEDSRKFKLNPLEVAGLDPFGANESGSASGELESLLEGRRRNELGTTTFFSGETKRWLNARNYVILPPREGLLVDLPYAAEYVEELYFGDDLSESEQDERKRTINFIKTSKLRNTEIAYHPGPREEALKFYDSLEEQLDDLHFLNGMLPDDAIVVYGSAAEYYNIVLARREVGLPVMTDAEEVAINLWGNYKYFVGLGNDLQFAYIGDDPYSEPHCGFLPLVVPK